MKTKAEELMRSEFDRCRTQCRKLNVNFSESAFKWAWTRAVGCPEYFKPKLEVDKYGNIYPERRAR